MIRPFTVLALTVSIAVAVSAYAQQDDDEVMSTGVAKRAQLRNALVRFGRSTGMRNALVRFGKRSADFGSYDSYDFKRNGAPQPFVRFGRSVQQQPSEQKYYVYSLADLMPNAV